MDLSSNSLAGSISPHIGNLTFLETLDLHMNSFNGQIPHVIGHLSGLRILDLSDNSLEGKVPNNLTSFTKLEAFSLSKNLLVGRIPNELGSVSKLAVLQLSGNYLVGTIPVSLSNLSFLTALAIGFNNLNGNIPANLGHLSKLEYLQTSYNNLSGSIPAQLLNISSIYYFSAANNQLIGSIPKPVTPLSSLSILDLSANLLSGTLPFEVGNLEKIVYLDLSKNQICGQIPSSMGKCLVLQNLYLQDNLFDGVIPSSLESISGVQILDLSLNRLSGQIPEFLGSFGSLKYLNLSYNDFRGEVPKQGVSKNISAFSILGNNNLCSEIPLLQLPSCRRAGPDNSQSKQFPLIRLLLIIFGAVLFAVFYCLFHIFIWGVKAQKIPLASSESPIGDMFRKVSYNELQNATNGFSTKNLVGVGSYGSVYRGILALNQETTTVVAVKVLNLRRRGASKSFMAECQALRCIRHRNLVKILTSCSSIDFEGNEFKSLVLEFMPNGSLEDWLHPTSNDEQLHRSTRRSLSFMERLDIVIDIATALDYLHRQCETPIVHCDLKPSNVLLDDDMIAHIGDFGLAKFLGEVIINVESESHTGNPSVGIRGTLGYAAPEYGMGREISKNGDVYSFGILLLELFTGRRPTDNMFKDGLSLHSFAKTSLLTDRVMQIVDPRTT